jgi:hypothetical protein
VCRKQFQEKINEGKLKKKKNLKFYEFENKKEEVSKVLSAAFICAQMHPFPLRRQRFGRGCGASEMVHFGGR